jgi:hypothetical protein
VTLAALHTRHVQRREDCASQHIARACVL